MAKIGINMLKKIGRNSKKTYKKFPARDKVVDDELQVAQEGYGLGDLLNETSESGRIGAKRTQTTAHDTQQATTGDSRQVTDTGTHPDTDATKPDKTQTAQPGGEKPSAAEKRADPKSGDEFNPLKYAEKAKDQNLGSSERQMYGRLWNMRVNAQKVFDKGTDEQIKNELGRWGIEAKDGTTPSDYMNKIDEMLRKKAESGPTIGDKFRAHHGVGLTGLGVVGVSTLDLANSRGQQSNAQLYSDPFA